MPNLPLLVEVNAPFVGRTVAVSTDPDDVIAVLQRILARRQREARELLDPASVPVALAEIERLNRLVAIVAPYASKKPARGDRQ